MNKIGLLTTLIALAIALPIEAGAKGRIRSSHSHTSPEAHPHTTGETHATEGGSGIIRNAIARPHRSQNGTTDSESGAQPGSAVSHTYKIRPRVLRSL